MTNNAQLLLLPEDREEFEMFLIRHLGPGALAGDKISIYDAAELAFAKGIEHGRNVLACIEAAKPPGNACLYDPDDVAFPKDFMPVDDPTCKPSLQVDALGSLPVVEYQETWPERIWLQQGEDAGEFETANTEEVTWCQGGQFTADIPYVRADIHSAEIAKRDAEIKKLNFHLELQGSGFKSLAERNAALFEWIVALQSKLAVVGVKPADTPPDQPVSAP